MNLITRLLLFVAGAALVLYGLFLSGALGMIMVTVGILALFASEF